jgi:hypothetical protein
MVRRRYEVYQTSHFGIDEDHRSLAPMKQRGSDERLGPKINHQRMSDDDWFMYGGSDLGLTQSESRSVHEERYQVPGTQDKPYEAREAVEGMSRDSTVYGNDRQDDDFSTYARSIPGAWSPRSSKDRMPAKASTTKESIDHPNHAKHKLEDHPSNNSSHVSSKGSTSTRKVIDMTGTVRSISDESNAADYYNNNSNDQALGLVSKETLLQDLRQSGLHKVKKIHQQVGKNVNQNPDIVGRDIVTNKDFSSEHMHEQETRMSIIDIFSSVLSGPVGGSYEVMEDSRDDGSMSETSEISNSTDTTDSSLSMRSESVDTSIKSVRFSDNIEYCKEKKCEPVNSKPIEFPSLMDNDENGSLSNTAKGMIPKKQGIFNKWRRKRRKKRTKHRKGAARNFKPTLEPTIEEDSFEDDKESINNLLDDIEERQTDPIIKRKISQTSAENAIQKEGKVAEEEGFELIAGLTKAGQRAIMIANTRHRRAQYQDETLKSSKMFAMKKLSIFKQSETKEITESPKNIAMATSVQHSKKHEENKYLVALKKRQAAAAQNRMETDTKHKKAALVAANNKNSSLVQILTPTNSDYFSWVYPIGCESNDSEKNARQESKIETNSSVIDDTEMKDILNAIETVKSQYEEVEGDNYKTAPVDEDVKKAVDNIRQISRRHGMNERELIEAVHSDDRSQDTFTLDDITYKSSRSSKSTRSALTTESQYRRNHPVAMQLIDMFDYLFASNNDEVHDDDDNDDNTCASL